MKALKNTTIIFLFALVTMPLFSFAFSDLRILNYRLNRKEENVILNTSITGSKVSIEISANIPVKFNTITICSVADNICNRTTAIKYFTKTDVLSMAVVKEWDGKTGKGAVSADGDYKIKVTMKDGAGIEKIQELAPYLIKISSTASASAPSQTLSKSSSFSSVFSQSDLNNDPTVKKIREFIASEEKKASVAKNSQIRIAGKLPGNNQNRIDNKNTETNKSRKEEKSFSSYSNQVQASAIVPAEDSNDKSFIWKILNLPLGGFNLIKKLFYSGV